MNARALRERWEIVALAPATLLLAPLLAYGTIGFFFAALGVASQNLSGARAVMLALAGIAAQSLLGIASLVCLWALVLGGVVRRNRPPHRRWVMVAFLGAGEADAVHFLMGRHVFREIIADVWSLLLWSVALVLPMIVGLRYLVLLLRPGFDKPRQ